MTWTAEFLDKPLWLWAIFLTVVVCLLAFDLGVLHRRSREIPLKESLFLSAAYILVAIAFGVWTWATLGSDAGAAFFSGYLLEKSLSLDNLFIISAIFGTLMVPRELQHRVLFWGHTERAGPASAVDRPGRCARARVRLGAAVVRRLPTLCRPAAQPPA